MEYLPLLQYNNFIMMKILLALTFIIFFIPISLGSTINEAPQLGEVHLELEEETPPEVVEEEIPLQEVAIIENDFSEPHSEKTLREKLSDVYHLEIYEYDKPKFMMKDILSYKFSESSPMDYTEFWAGYNGNIGINFTDDGKVSNHYSINALNFGCNGVFKDNNADFRVMLNISPQSRRNFVQNLFSDVYVATNKVPHNRFIIGNSRPAVGMEGRYSGYTIPFLARAQIARNFGTVRRLGARVIGDYPLVDYDLGVYSSDTYFQEFFPGAEFVGWVDFKPLGKTNGRYGNLKIGAGIEGGHRSNNYFVTGAYIGYDYKKFMVNFEWANANGYNGPSGESTNIHASGFYATLGYMITKKLQLLLRYDQFNPNHAISHTNQREYSVGLNYFIKGQALRVILNYVFCQNDASRDSHRIMLGTQILI